MHHRSSRKKKFAVDEQKFREPEIQIENKYISQNQRKKNSKKVDSKRSSNRAKEEAFHQVDYSNRNTHYANSSEDSIENLRRLRS